ncbi:MAG TPA: C1 family peptidase [Polyangia bacterium]|nr:C1 family peptidase [Polyangia bacterium]
MRKVGFCALFILAGAACERRNGSHDAADSSTMPRDMSGEASSDLAVTDSAVGDLAVADLAVPDLAVADLAVPDLSQSPDLFTPDFAMPDLSMLVGAYDVRPTGAVVPVKNSGACAASGAFAITDAMSASWFAVSGSLRSLSEQVIFDCMSLSCDDLADFHTPLPTLVNLPGEAQYPYTARSGTCKQTTAIVALDSYELFDPIDTVIAAHLQMNELVLVVLPNSSAIQNATGLVMRDDCSDATDNVSGAIVAYGDDATTGTPYWTIKMAHGTIYGESGYLQVSRATVPGCQFVGQVAVLHAKAAP